jgi:plastocyanin
MLGPLPGRLTDRTTSPADPPARTVAGRTRTALLAALLVATGAALAACGDDDASSSGGDGDGLAGEGDEPSGEVPDDVVVVEGAEVRVRAPHIQIRPGATVTWTNDGRNEHDVLPVEGDAWGVEVADFQPGDTYEHTFSDPGVYDYYCSIHGTTTAGMIGTVVVAED